MTVPNIHQSIDLSDTVLVDHSVDEALTRMKSQKRDHLIVLDGDRAIGVVARRALEAATPEASDQRRGAQPLRRHLLTEMLVFPHTIEESEAVEEIRRIGHPFALVVDGDGRIVRLLESNEALDEPGSPTGDANVTEASRQNASTLMRLSTEPHQDGNTEPVGYHSEPHAARQNGGR